jgi:hypothetical protein
MVNRHPFSLFFLVALIVGLSLCWSVQGASAQDEDQEQDSAQVVSEAQLRGAIGVQSSHEETLLAIPGVVAVGVGLAEDGAHAIHVYLNKDIPSASAAAVPQVVGNVPVRIFETDEIRALQIFPLPVPMGVSTGPNHIIMAGTLGFRAHRIGQTFAVGYVTNNHVAAANSSSVCPAQLNPARTPTFGRDQCQPGRLDAPNFQCRVPPIGDLVQAIPIVMGGSFQNTVDAAFVTSTRSLVSKSIRNIGNPSPTVQEPAVGLGVRKNGRTTGLRTGTIQTINTTVNVNYGSGCGTGRFVGQVLITPGTFSAPGDSGSLILGGLDSANRRRPVALLFAGSSTITVGNRIADVLGALHIQVDTQ